MSVEWNIISTSLKRWHLWNVFLSKYCSHFEALRWFFKKKNWRLILGKIFLIVCLKLTLDKNGVNDATTWHHLCSLKCSSKLENQTTIIFPSNALSLSLFLFHSLSLSLSLILYLSFILFLFVCSLSFYPSHIISFFVCSLSLSLSLSLFLYLSLSCSFSLSVALLASVQSCVCLWVQACVCVCMCVRSGSLKNLQNTSVIKRGKVIGENFCQVWSLKKF